MPTPTSWWTKVRVEELETRLRAGETFSEITLAMHANSRNAVIGKAHRLGLTTMRAPSPVQELPRKRRRRRSTPPPPNTKVHTMVEAPPANAFQNPKTLIELTADDCRWPNGAPFEPATAFCAAPKLNGSAYCAYHTRLAYTRVLPRHR